MHARLVRFRLGTGASSGFGTLYEGRILPALRATEGCLGAALLARVGREEELISLTLWNARRHAQAYDASGRFARLLNEAEHFLSEGDGPDAAAGGLSREDDLSVAGYAAELLVPADLGAALVAGSFARTVTASVARDRIEEFDRRYRAEVTTALADFPGLFAVLLLHGADKPGATVGLSFWHGEDAAARYDLSGRFEDLASNLRETLSPVSRWRSAWVAGEGPHGAAADLEVDLYQVRSASVF